MWPRRAQMSPRFRDIEKRAKNLPKAERDRPAESLPESLRPEGTAEVEAAWEWEIEARVAAFRRGEEKLIDGEAVLAELRPIAR